MFDRGELKLLLNLFFLFLKVKYLGNFILGWRGILICRIWGFTTLKFRFVTQTGAS